jgi:hypothetical protein
MESLLGRVISVAFTWTADEAVTSSVAGPLVG